MPAQADSEGRPAQRGKKKSAILAGACSGHGTGLYHARPGRAGSVRVDANRVDAGRAIALARRPGGQAAGRHRRGLSAIALHCRVQRVGRAQPQKVDGYPCASPRACIAACSSSSTFRALVGKYRPCFEAWLSANGRHCGLGAGSARKAPRLLQ